MVQIQKLRIYFGTAQTAIAKTELDSFATSHELGAVPIIAQLADRLSLKHVISLRQVHGTAGYEITEQNICNITPDLPGDYLITRLSCVGLAVFTADCMPLLFYDTEQDVIALCHAGWRGSVAGIVPDVLNKLQHNYGSHPEDILVIFGPSAQACCYEVGPEFSIYAQQASQPDKIISTRENRLFFNLPEYLKQLLEQYGLRQFNFEYALCTICNPHYSSHRREKEQAKRQITLVALISEQFTAHACTAG